MGILKNLSNVAGKFGDFVHDTAQGGIDIVKSVGHEIGNLGSAIDDAIRDIIPGGWTTIAEAGLALTPAGALGSAAFGALSGGTGGFRKKFDVSGAIMGGLQGYGIGSMATSLASAGAPSAAGGYETGANYNVNSASNLSSTPATPPPTDYGVRADYGLGSATPTSSFTPPSSPTGLSRVTLAPDASTYYSPDYVGGLKASSAAPAGSISSSIPTSSYVSGQPSGPYEVGKMNLGSDANKLGVQAPAGSNYTPPGPSRLEALGSGMSDKASQIGQGVKNLTGFGPEGVSGIIPAAQNVNAGMSYTAYAGLGSIALQEMAQKNQEKYEKGQIPSAEYLKNQREIDEAVAQANAAVQKYTYEPDAQLTTEQPTSYGKKQKTLYDEMAQADQPQTNYAFGGTVESQQYSDDMATGGLTGGFKFNSNNQLPMYAVGGSASGLGSYASGGSPRFLSGGGDGMSDSIRANIDGHQEARLADGEFVIPADVVSHLGNGSSKAGAKQLHAMMDRIRKARTGNPKQGKQINPLKLMPA